MGNKFNGLLMQAVFQPPSSSYGKDPSLIWLITDMGEVIPAFYIEAKDAGPETFTLLFSHGNAEDLGLIIKYFREVSQELNVNIFAYEYTGYGMSTRCTGSVIHENCVYADIEAAFKYLRDIMGVDWRKIVLFGRSIGTGPSCHLATRTAVRGMILQSPMVSIFRIPFHFRFTLPGDLFTNIDKVRDMATLVAIIHGTRDEIVPCWHGEAMHEALSKKGLAYPAFWVAGADHNTLEQHAGQAFFDHLRQFLDHLRETEVSPALQHQADTSTLRDSESQDCLKH